MIHPLATPQPNTICQCKNREEIAFYASVIDGTAISIAEYCEKKRDEVFTRYCLTQFYLLISISVQVKSEEDFIKHLDLLWNEFKSKLPPLS